MDRATFETIYWAHQPPEICNLHNFEHNYNGPGDSPRIVEAKRLALKGYVVDVPIHIWDWDAFDVMGLRLSYGQTTVPSMTGGQIKVSLDAADYPAFDPPKPPLVEHKKDELIGPPVFGIPGWFSMGIGDNLPDGARLETETKGVFVKHRMPVASPFGVSWINYFEKVG